MVMKLLWTFLVFFAVAWLVISTPAAKEHDWLGTPALIIFGISFLGLIVTVLLRIWKG